MLLGRFDCVYGGHLEHANYNNTHTHILISLKIKLHEELVFRMLFSSHTLNV